MGMYGYVRWEARNPSHFEFRSNLRGFFIVLANLLVSWDLSPFRLNGAINCRRGYTKSLSLACLWPRMISFLRSVYRMMYFVHALFGLQKFSGLPVATVWLYVNLPYVVLCNERSMKITPRLTPKCLHNRKRNAVEKYFNPRHFRVERKNSYLERDSNPHIRVSRTPLLLLSCRVNNTISIRLHGIEIFSRRL